MRSHARRAREGRGAWIRSNTRLAPQDPQKVVNLFDENNGGRCVRVSIPPYPDGDLFEKSSTTSKWWPQRDSTEGLLETWRSMSWRSPVDNDLRRRSEERRVGKECI